MTGIVVLVAHGSRNPAANAHHVALAADLAGELGTEVRPAFLELAAPSIDEALDAAAGAGVDQVLVLPHFLGPGRHVERDIPDIIEGARSRHPGLTIRLAAHTGASPEMVQLLGTAARAGLADAAP